jgi:imidazolonepropionase-like amidohydrolase
MQKAKRIFKRLFLGLIFIIFILVLILGISIPYGKSTEIMIENPGISYAKLVLKNVHILTMVDDSILKNKNLYLENGKITHIQDDSLKIRNGYAQINAKGKFIMPGLIDMHAHIFDRNDLPQYLSYGITTVRNMMGFPMHLRWKQQLLNNEFPGSTLFTATPTINSGENAGPFHKVINDESEMQEALMTYAKAGYDFIKVYDDIDANQLNTIQKTAKKYDFMVAGHPPKISFESLLSSSLISIEHVEELRKFLDKENSDKSIRAIAKQIKKSNKAVTINLIAFNRIYNTAIKGQAYLDDLNIASINPIINYIGNKQLTDYTEAGSKYKAFAKRKFGTLKKIAKALSDEGVEILLGTDSGPNLIVPGKSVFEEMKLLSEAGITNYNILKSATINAASVLQKNDIGSIKLGNKSNLILIDTNPLIDIKALQKPLIIFKESAYYTPKEINQLRSVGENKQGKYATVGLFLEHLINK